MCILFTCHISPLQVVVVYYCVFMCRVISFPKIVRKRPHLHVGVLVLREDRLQRMLLASPLVAPLIVENRALSPFVDVAMVTEKFIPENQSGMASP